MRDCSLEHAKGFCVEVGTWNGEFSKQILNIPAVQKLVCVDPYKHYENNEYPDAMNDLTQIQFDVKYAYVSNHLVSQYANRVDFIRKESVEAAKSFQDGSLDYVYIDGNHNYKHVLDDLNAWYPKLKKGGYLCGDDIVSTNLDEHDEDGNVVHVWHDGSWGKYGTYKAIVDFGKPFKINGSQFSIFVE
jgi:hypothetical protein